MKQLAALLLFTISLTLSAQKFEGLALTPPMGWNSWNKFACDVSEAKIREVADAMVSTGMKDAGYEYVVIDDCWHGERDAQGFITANTQRFPSGIKALADYIHAKGLKFGIYSCAGSRTCAGYPGSQGHEFQDAITYASWGVDYLKYDWCNTGKRNAEEAYTTMSQALRAAGRPVVFSLCEWGRNKPWEWAKPVGHLWRTTGDIFNCYDCVKGRGSRRVSGAMQILDKQDGLRKFAGPGHWNDPDMMEVGNGMTVNEERAHFTMWCMLAAPLMAGNDLRSMSLETLGVLSNREAIAINQDSLGIQCFRYEVKDSVETWLKPLQNGRWALSFLNRSTSPKSINIDWKTFSVKDPLNGLEINTTDQQVWQLQDVWKPAPKKLMNTKKPLVATIPGHDVLCLKVFK